MEKPKDTKKKGGSYFVDTVMASETSLENAKAAVNLFLDLETTALVHLIAHEHDYRKGEYPSEEFIRERVLARTAAYSRREKEIFYLADDFCGAALDAHQQAASELLPRVTEHFLGRKRLQEQFLQLAFQISLVAVRFSANTVSAEEAVAA